jgi:serine/threonine-protein kinase
LLTNVPQGVRFGAYTSLRLLGRGGMASVYEALHDGSGKRFALKVLSESLAVDSVASRRFLREAEVIANIQHPHVVQVFDVGIEGKIPFIVMELLEGETLAQRVRKQGRLPTETLVDVFLGVLSAVAAIHDAGVVHRDLKTSNVMLTRREDSCLHPVVLDFGISKVRRSWADETPLTQSRVVLGTLRYLSPEQTLNARAAGPFSDQYALGVMLYECATGHGPFVGGSPYELMHAIVHGTFLPPNTYAPELPTGLAEVMLTAMNRDVTQRFANVRAFGNELLKFGSPRAIERWTSEFVRGDRFDEALDITERDGSIRAFSIERSPPALAVVADRNDAKSARNAFLIPAALALLGAGLLASGDFLSGSNRLAQDRTTPPTSTLPTAIPEPPRSARLTSARPPPELPAGPEDALRAPSAADGVRPATEPPLPRRQPAAKRTPTRDKPMQKRAAEPGKDDAIDDPFAPVP